ncbi:hypothetical protein VPH35_087359 [Triticum aestivum]|uniref:uncharacterized protein isoform X1 n=1 Tax=Triticum aestivum TaxID=4565 RepID=UPI001D0132DB|nr:uncharacterized protein LOC123106163 isoform X1 [Triticum aestivum]
MEKKMLAAQRKERVQDRMYQGKQRGGCHMVKELTSGFTAAVEEEQGEEHGQSSEEEGDVQDELTDEDFYERDFDVQDGDDDMFDAHVDKNVDDHIEKTEFSDYEAELLEDALEDSHLNMSREEKEKLKHKFSVFNPTTDLNALVFKLGMVFADMIELRHALNAYSVRNRVKVRKLRNTNRSLEAVCKDDCTWYLKAGKDNRSSSIQIKKYTDKHTCTKAWDLKVLTAPFLTKQFREEFRGNEKMPLLKFSEKVEQEFNLVAHRSKLGRARRAAVKEIRGEDDDQYNTLWDYGQELRRSNPGSLFFLCTKEVFDDKAKVTKDHFSTLYWSYDACKRGFLKGCRPIIFLDGCHIKTRYKGNILTAVGIDPNDCIFPIAFGICEVESTHSWEWFLASLKDDLNIINTSTFTIMSDRQKGLTNAMKKVFPDSEHRNCVRHIYQNFHKVHKGEQLKNDLWAIARSTNEAAYTRNMDKMRDHSFAAFNWVENLSPRTWIKAFFDPFCKCDILLNNMCEVFNSYILDGRELPIKSMLDYIFWKTSNRMVGKQREAEKWTGRLCPKIQKKLDKYVEWAKNCRVREYGRGVFQVISLNNTYIVDLNMLSCNCKRWELSGIPCHHAIACFRHERIEPESMVHSCYTIEEYKKWYGFNMRPMRDPEEWEKMHGNPVFPPIYTKVMGRPKESRKKDPEEKKDKKGVRKLTKHGVSMHCSVCGGADHNKKGHYKHVNQPPTEEAPGESEEEYNDPSIIAEKFTYPAPMDFGPLPESSFIANARDTIPIGRVTTAMSRGRVRGGTSGSNATRGGRSARNATRGGRSGTNARRGGRSASNATRGGRIVSNATRGGTAPSATRGGNYPSGSNPPRGARAAAP